VKITILSENHKGNNSCKTEHGLSQWIEVDGKRILFDLGGSKLYLKNAKKIGIDLQTADFLVLSHGHFDHGVGLDYFPYKKPLLLHPNAFTYRTHKVEWDSVDIMCGLRNIVKGRKINYSGILSKEQAQQKFDIIETKKPYQITENSYFLGEIPRTIDFESGDKYSNLLDDSAIVIKTDKGLVITSGCAHSGICNTIEYAKKVMDEDRIYIVMGGFHLGFGQKGVPEKAIKTIEYFAENKIQNAYLGHCTSNEVISAFNEALNDVCNVECLYVGKKIDV